MVSSFPLRQFAANGQANVLTRSEPADDVYVMPTSLAQQRFWLLDQLQPGNTSLNMPLALRLVGDLDRTVLKRTIDEIVSRHEVLRTTFRSDNGRPMQVISTDNRSNLDLVDLTERADRDEEKDKLILDEAHSVFDLERGPLFKTKLIKLASDEHILLLTMHHIVCDGWSNGVLVREIGNIYEAFSQGLSTPYEELPIQYADFAVWQSEWLHSQRFDEQVSYWKHQLGTELPSLELPTDFPREKNGNSLGAIESVLLPNSLTKAVKALAQREDLTAYMIFLASFSVLLSTYGEQDEILIGSPMANRFPSETETLIGPFANTLLLKTDLAGDPAFREVLEKTKEVVLGAFSNQEMPFEKLVEIVRPSQRRKGGQLFQVLFIYQTAFMQPMKLKGLSIEPIRSVSPGSVFELSLGVVERAEGIRLQLEYNTDLFKSGTIRRMLENMQTILRSAVLDSNKNVSSLFTKAKHPDAIDKTAENGSDHSEAGAGNMTAVVGPDERLLETLKEIWKEVLHLESIGAQDDFFEVGGHSLLAAQLFNEIGKRLGVNLTLATLFQASTVEQLAKVIRDQKPRDKWTSLVPIKPVGSKTPLFLMHAAGGNVLFYKDLAGRLSENQPCYGMQAVGLDGHQSAYDRVEDMAAHYIKEIREIQNHGPYNLGGSSVGGLIAFEAGRQLQNAGEEVSLIALFDTFAPGFPKYLPGTSGLRITIMELIDRVQHHIDTIRILEAGKRWPYLSAKAAKARHAARRSYTRTKQKVVRGVITGLGRPLPEALAVTQNAISAAAKAYDPKPSNLDVVLFRASKQKRGTYQDDSLGWSNYVHGQIKIHEVNGSHGTIVAEPRVRFVATILDDLMKDPQQR